MTPEQREELKVPMQELKAGAMYWWREGDTVHTFRLGQDKSSVKSMQFWAGEESTGMDGWVKISHHVSPGGPIMATITTVFKRGPFTLTYEGGMGGESWKLDGPGTKEDA